MIITKKFKKSQREKVYSLKFKSLRISSYSNFRITQSSSKKSTNLTTVQKHIENQKSSLEHIEHGSL